MEGESLCACSSINHLKKCVIVDCVRDGVGCCNDDLSAEATGAQFEAGSNQQLFLLDRANCWSTAPAAAALAVAVVVGGVVLLHSVLVLVPVGLVSAGLELAFFGAGFWAEGG